jgi:hypothetical protein
LLSELILGDRHYVSGVITLFVGWVACDVRGELGGCVSLLGLVRLRGEGSVCLAGCGVFFFDGVFKFGY